MQNARNGLGLSQERFDLLMESLAEELVFMRDTVKAFGVEGFDRMSLVARNPSHPLAAIMIVDDNVDEVIKILQSLRRATTIETMSKQIQVTGTMQEIENICKIGVLLN